jgi:hypothetical protein
MAFSFSSLLGSNQDDPYAPSVNKRLIVVIGSVIGLIVLVAIGLLVFNSVSSGPRDAFMLMLARQQFINSVTATSDNISHIKSDDLAKANIDASTLFATDTLNLYDQLSAQYNQSSVSSDATSAASDATVATQLANAQLLGNFDSVYRDTLSQKIDTLIATTPAIRNAVNDTTYHQVMDKYISDLKTIKAELSAISF